LFFIAIIVRHIRPSVSTSAGTCWKIGRGVIPERQRLRELATPRRSWRRGFIFIEFQVAESVCLITPLYLGMLLQVSFNLPIIVACVLFVMVVPGLDRVVCCPRVYTRLLYQILINQISSPRSGPPLAVLYGNYSR